jgi:phenylpropionate dioxygenase-like ring-hydroxylating dioxygenase large terminal subunit
VQKENALTPALSLPRCRFRPAPLPSSSASAHRPAPAGSSGRTRRPGSAHPVENYTSDSIRAAEIARLFRPLPLIAGHASELAPGQVLAHDDYGVPLLLTREADGRFRAFLNVCRHRGMRLVAATGKAEPRAERRLPVPRLDLQARRRAAPSLHAEAFDDCSAADTNLVALPCEERHGLLWVVPTPGRRSTSPPGSPASTPSCRSSASKG